MEKILEVWRGKEILTMDSRLIDFSGMITSTGHIEREQYTNFLHNLQLSSKYSGSDCINSFYADKKIKIVGCGFFGPLPSKLVGKTVANYEVSLRLEMVWKSSQDKNGKQKTRILSQVCKNVDISIDKNKNDFSIFYVDFDSPVELDENAIKYNLVFRMEGPSSYELDPTKFETRIESNGINFFFFSGSKQMPVLRFILDEDS